MRQPIPLTLHSGEPARPSLQGSCAGACSHLTTGGHPASLPPLQASFFPIGEKDTDEKNTGGQDSGGEGHRGGEPR